MKRYSSECAIVAPEKEKVRKLELLAIDLTRNRFLFNGVDDEAKQNNLLVIKTIQEVGASMNQLVSQGLCGIRMMGSRTLGYHTSKSDVDIAIIQSGGNKGFGHIFDAIETQLRSKNISNNIDSLNEALTQYNICDDVDGLIEQVTFRTNELLGLFGYAVYQNPNLSLAKLSVLEILKTMHPDDRYWEWVQQDYKTHYLGSRKHMINKAPQRYGVTENTVKDVITQKLFKERYTTFGLPNPEKLYSPLKTWYTKNRHKLTRYPMFSTYQGVLECFNQRSRVKTKQTL